MTEIKETGGARIGMANATWPFATLKVTRDKLELNASIIGNLVFKPSDIISIEPYSRFLSSGLKINHSVSNYNDQVIFWTLGNANSLIQKIEGTGFLTNDDPLTEESRTEIAAMQSKAGFPIKTWFAVTVVVIWNLLFLYDFTNSDKGGFPLGIGAQFAVGFVFGAGVLLLVSTPFRKLILKEGRTLNHIKKFVYFLLFICGFMLLQMTLTL